MVVVLVEHNVINKEYELILNGQTVMRQKYENFDQKEEARRLVKSCALDKCYRLQESKVKFTIFFTDVNEF